MLALNFNCSTCIDAGVFLLSLVLQLKMWMHLVAYLLHTRFLSDCETLGSSWVQTQTIIELGQVEIST